MDTPLEIAFKGLDKSRAIEAKIMERAGRLQRHFDRMTHCRVVVSAPNKHAHKGKVYEIKIDIGIPGDKPLIVTHEAAVANASESLHIALRDAFDAAERRLDELHDRRDGAAKAERSRRKPAKVRVPEEE
jgi:ribosome-associated translation inhibitor RaiA